MTGDLLLCICQISWSDNQLLSYQLIRADEFSAWQPVAHLQVTVCEEIIIEVQQLFIVISVFIVWNDSPRRR